MKTKLPHEGRISLNEYLERYFLTEGAVTTLPSDEELKDLAHRSIVKDYIELRPLPESERAASGDVAKLKTESVLSKFNKSAVTLTLGAGLYDKELEREVCSHKKGENINILCSGENVSVTILELKRKYVPEPTDEMVKGLRQTDTENKPVNTVSEYEHFVREQKITETLSLVFGGVMELICSDISLKEIDEDDIRILGELEKVWFHEFFLKDEGIDLYALTPEEMMKRFNCPTFDDFIKGRRLWYEIKIHQCLIMLNVLDLPCEGRTDPCDHYEVYQELTFEMFGEIKRLMENKRQSAA